MDKFFLVLTIGFILTLIISPLIIKFAKRLKANQPVYEYVDMHKKKSGTPTMGGISFILGIIFSSCIFFNGNYKLALVTLAVFFAYGVVGFLDDFIKVKYKHNEGLKPYQKIIFQLIIAVVVTMFAYFSDIVGTSIYIPFVNKEIELGIFYIPLTIFVFLALTNSVNLTDGLDGLASGVGLAYTTSFAFILFTIFYGLVASGVSNLIISEYSNLLLVIGATIGSLLAYLLFNSFPAQIFMGDTGSLSLGGLFACFTIFTKLTLLIPILGFMFVVSAVSVILQVVHFKRTKKRLFLIAPFHHHLEKKGVNETKIVVIYIIITAMIGVISEMLYLIFF